MNYHRANGSVKVLHIKLRFHGKLLHNLRCVRAQLPSKRCCGGSSSLPAWRSSYLHQVSSKRSATVRLTLRSVACSHAPEVLEASATELICRKLSVCWGGTENSLKEDKHHIPWLQCTHEARDSLPSKAAGRQAQEQVAGSTLARGKDSVLGVRNTLMLARPQASRSIFAN